MGDKVPIETYESIAKKCDRQEQEIERLKRENEEFRVDNCKVNEERAHVQGRNMVFKEEIERLLKENEWLINQLAYISRKDGELIVEEMQHALKDKT